MREGTVIRFGEDGFLRGSVDYFFQELQGKGLSNDSVAIVQPIERRMYGMLEQQGCEYNLLLRGIDNGQVVDEHTHVDITSRRMNPYENFESCMKLTENLDFRFIVSNTTEVGIGYMDPNQFTDTPAKSLPGRLTQLLYRRFCLELEGFIIPSCELIGHNGEELRERCLRYTDLWGLGGEFKTWLVQENDFCSALVDRIVTGLPKDEHEELCRRIDEQDNMMDTVEIFHLWVIQGSHEDELPLQKTGFHVVWTDNVNLYKKGKMRILNGAYTSMVLGTHLYGLKTVGECLEDEKVSALLRKCIFGEIISAIGDTENNRKFGEAVLERFSNPSTKHILLSIALNSVPRFRVRVLPTILEYRDMFGSYPQGLTFLLATLVVFCRTGNANGNQETMDFMRAAPVKDILKREDYWGQGLSLLLGNVKKWYELIETEDMSKTYNTVLSEVE